ncbi:MAG: ribosome silencing factor [Pseudomonadota bacterium]
MEDITLADTNSAVANAPAKSPADLPQGTAGPATSEKILARILSSLDDDKAEDVVQVSLSGKSDMADHMVIASGRSTRQVAAIAEKMIDRLKQDLGVLCKVEGKDAADWVLIDAGDVIVHVFRPEVREFYQLEKMWQSPAEAAAQV